MDYSWGELEFEVQPMNRMLLADAGPAASRKANAASYDLDLEPDDVAVSDTVTVVWQIG